MMTSFRRIVLLSTVAAFCAGGAFAQTGDSRYGAWSPPGATSGTVTTDDAKLQQLLKELESLVNEAEKARAADRMFLRDLRDLAARYANPWTKRILSDDFADGEFLRDPAWTVRSGDFWVERDYGLRARVVDVAAQPSQDSQPRQITKEEAIIGILGAVLQGANNNGTNGGSGGGAAATPTNTQPSNIETRANITNAFAVNMQLSSWSGQGAFELAVTQGVSGAGYRVVYRAGPNPALELVKVTSRGRGVVDAKSIAALEDKKFHTLTWTRSKDGAMAVSLDGKQVLSARDVSFRDPFDALGIEQAGTDVIVKSVSVLGAP